MEEFRLHSVETCNETVEALRHPGFTQEWYASCERLRRLGAVLVGSSKERLVLDVSVAYSCSTRVEGNKI